MLKDQVWSLPFGRTGRQAALLLCSKLSKSDMRKSEAVKSGLTSQNEGGFGDGTLYGPPARV